MMANNRPKGICHICGKYGTLSFEHVPPKQAFNNRRVITIKFDQAISLGPDERPKGRIQQRGAGAYTLCEKCNNNAGGWYGKQFVNWCYRGMTILQRSNGNPSLVYMNELYLLAIIKQIAVMFFSVNPSSFQKVHPELVSFVLTPEAKYLSTRYRFFAYYNIEGRFRYLGAMVTGDVYKREYSVLSEISFPPFGYVMTLNSPAPDNRLVDITHFSRYDYNQSVMIPLKLPVLPTFMPVPGDYRSKGKIYQDASRNPNLVSSPKR